MSGLRSRAVFSAKARRIALAVERRRFGALRLAARAEVLFRAGFLRPAPREALRDGVLRLDDARRRDPLRACAFERRVFLRAMLFLLLPSHSGLCWAPFKSLPSFARKTSMRCAAAALDRRGANASGSRAVCASVLSSDACAPVIGSFHSFAMRSLTRAIARGSTGKKSSDNGDGRRYNASALPARSPEKFRRMTVCKPAFPPRALALFAALLLAGCADAANPPKPTMAGGESTPNTPEEAKTQCWMRYENKSAPRDLDKRMALVDKCIEEKMKQLPRAQ
jgi:hypothetical protein